MRMLEGCYILVNTGMMLKDDPWMDDVPTQIDGTMSLEWTHLG